MSWIDDDVRKEYQEKVDSEEGEKRLEKPIAKAEEQLIRAGVRIGDRWSSTVRRLLDDVASTYWGKGGFLSKPYSMMVICRKKYYKNMGTQKWFKPTKYNISKHATCYKWRARGPKEKNSLFNYEFRVRLVTPPFHSELTHQELDRLKNSSERDFYFAVDEHRWVPISEAELKEVLVELLKKGPNGRVELGPRSERPDYFDINW